LNLIEGLEFRVQFSQCETGQSSNKRWKRKLYHRENEIMREQERVTDRERERARKRNRERERERGRERPART
jgi:hypothetical protein